MNYDTCPKCGQKATLMYSHNPGAIPICFSCIKGAYDYENLVHANLFCRTFDIPFDPNHWIKVAEEKKGEVFRLYTESKMPEMRAYKDAAEIYETKERNQEVLQNLGDSYYYNTSLQKAIKTYRELFVEYGDSIDIEYHFRLLLRMQVRCLLILTESVCID